jgi:hypothetical protein
MLCVVSEQDTREEMIKAMKLHLGGNLKLKDSQPVDSGQRQEIYYCPEEDEKGVPCPFRASIQSHGPCKGIQQMKRMTWVRIVGTKERKEKGPGNSQLRRCCH